ncbi:hypothetical protein FDECE_15815 [Fusarium decemcellulare]|nr:hypothetical protein FDECE_15815 [Fusarium decemcellulare]
MRPSTLFLNVCGAALASAGCFTSGDLWDIGSDDWGVGVQAALDAAKKFCDDGTLSGDFIPHQYKFACSNLNSVLKVDFRVAADGLPRITTPAINMSPEQCLTYLSKEINGCDLGGSSSVDFPNAGSFTFT